MSVIDQPQDMSGASPNMSSAKSALRVSMRRARQSLTDRTARSEVLWAHVRALDAAAGAHRILLFDAIVGEPDTEPFADWCRGRRQEVAVPGDHVDASWPDVVIVPGLAFTAGGDRLGQGGGWYDRFLAGIRDDCTTIGVGFDIQIVAELPIEPHDIRLHHVVTESGRASERSPA